MPLSEPSWWYQAEPTLVARLLTPIANAYGAAVSRRFARAMPFRAARPVICVGNFTAGGTGKTPLALALADQLESIGAAPWYLTRGYGGRRAGPHRVDLETDTARDVGDETLLLARRAPTVVSLDRPSGARAIAAAAPANAVIVMDDGLQNPTLAKDLTLAVVDGGRGLGNGAVFPAGPLRAPLELQLGLVDAIIVNRPSSVGGVSDIAERLRRSFPGPVLSSITAPRGDVAWLAGARVAAFAGIGHPDRFFKLLERLGATIVLRRVFADHQRLRERDAERLLSEAAGLGATLVTTAKDIARLTGGGRASRALAETARALEIAITFETHESARLHSLVLGVQAAAARPARPPI